MYELLITNIVNIYVKDDHSQVWEHAFDAYGVLPVDPHPLHQRSDKRLLLLRRGLSHVLADVTGDGPGDLLNLLTPPR